MSQNNSSEERRSVIIKNLQDHLQSDIQDVTNPLVREIIEEQRERVAKHKMLHEREKIIRSLELIEQWLEDYWEVHVSAELNLLKID